jgi:FKBP-type peptidyl-prolyl cis-trans isomerase
MLPARVTRPPLLAAALMLLAAAAVADDEKKDPGKLPPLDAKEWKKLDNGMKVWDVKAGDGEEVKKDARITIHYTGWFTDGNIFDTTRKELAGRLPKDHSPSGAPITFPLDRLIKGWQEGLPGAKVGGVRRLYIPYQLGYGEAGAPPTIRRSPTWCSRSRWSRSRTSSG